MGITNGGQFDDVDNSSYLAGSITASTSQTEVKVGASKLDGRQVVMVQNTGNNTVYLGPSGVTTSSGIPLVKNQFISIPIGDNIALYIITGTGTSTVVVQELG